jgi:hypothetical protein
MPALFTVVITLSVIVALFGSGYWFGKTVTVNRLEQRAAEERLASLEATTDTYSMLIEMQRRHGENMRSLETQLKVMDKSFDKAIENILKNNPEIARWYREPINDIERAVMYGNPANGVLPPNTTKPAGANTH